MNEIIRSNSKENIIKNNNSILELISETQINIGTLLIQLPQVSIENIDANVVKNKGYFAYPPYGLLYISEVFNLNNIDTEILDLNYFILNSIKNNGNISRDEYLKELDFRINKHKLKFICISYMFDATYKELRHICEYLRSNYPDLIISIGGVAATSNPKKLLREGLADMVFSHEAEQTIQDFIDYIRGNNSIIIKNIDYIIGNKLYISDKLPGGHNFLNITRQYEKIEIGNYYNIGMSSIFSKLQGQDKPYATLLTKRGCRGKCSFCSVRNFNGKGVRIRESGSVIDEMKYLYEKHGIRHFELLDDDFLYNTEEVIVFLKDIISNFSDITWSANNGLIATNLNIELLDLMVRSGCVGFKIGMESGNNEILKKIHKPIGIKSFIEFSRRIKYFPELFVSANFILGTPDETFSKMIDSFSVASHGGLNWTNLYTYQHFKNTEFDLLYKNIETSSSNNSIGRESNEGSFNVVEKGKSNNNTILTDIESGYDIFNIGDDIIPNKDQLKEIWFTFNIIINFLNSSSLYTENKIKLNKMIKWIELLSKSYPEDPLMISFLYYLKWKNGADMKELEKIKNKAILIIEKSNYWQNRDKQFNFSLFLEKQVPEINEKVLYILKNKKIGMN